MKKLLLLAVCCLCLCGCGKEKENNDFHASNFTWKEAAGLNYAAGSIQNNTSKKCNSLYFDLIFKNGNIEESQIGSYLEGIAPGEIINVENMYLGKFEDLTSVSIEVQNIKCFDQYFE